ncbi:hypothetical protein D9M71_834830 [compost metagenome]
MTNTRNERMRMRRTFSVMLPKNPMLGSCVVSMSTEAWRMVVMRLTANTPSTMTSKAMKAKPRKARGAMFRLRRDIGRYSGD